MPMRRMRAVRHGHPPVTVVGGPLGGGGGLSGV